MKLESQKIYKEDKIWLTITKWKLLYYQNSPKEDMKRQNSIKKKKMCIEYHSQRTNILNMCFVPTNQ